VADARHDNSHMVLEGEQGAVLIDCASSPLVRLEAAGIPRDRLTHLIATHFHPDHVYGLPILFMNLWLLGRHSPLAVYGLHHCLERIEHLMEDFGWSEWPNFFRSRFTGSLSARPCGSLTTRISRSPVALGTIGADDRAARPGRPSGRGWATERNARIYQRHCRR
jgi:ribonuclease BN (tRNA processing enzyme)